MQLPFFIVKLLSSDLNGWTVEILHSAKPLCFICILLSNKRK